MVDEKELFLLISKGDERAFHKLFHLYNKQLLPFIYKLTQSESAAEEIVQEAFIKIWKSRDKLHEIQIPKAWIIRIVSNLSYNWLRKKAVEGRLIKVMTERSENYSLTPEESLRAKEISKVINDGIQQLPPQMKKVFLLNKEEGLNIYQIAEKLEVSPNTAKNQLVSAMKKLREYLRANKMDIIIALISSLGQKFLEKLV